jgi:hypothetical protein
MFLNEGLFVTCHFSWLIKFDGHILWFLVGDLMHFAETARIPNQSRYYIYILGTKPQIAMHVVHGKSTVGWRSIHHFRLD